jgi:thiamine pyrophosphate-dependent acetolactate synthase large subunit-like protein
VGTSFTLSKFTARVPPGKVIGQITVDESDLGKDYQVSFGAIGDAKAVLGQTIELLRSENNGRWVRGDVTLEIRSVKKDFLNQWKPRLTSSERPINPYRVVWELMHVFDPARTVVTHDSGSPRDQLVPFYESAVPGGYLGWGKSTPLGASLGLMMGAKLARPEWAAVHLMGNAAFGMAGMDVETAVRNRIPVLTVLMNNGVMGGYVRKQPSACELYDLHRLSGDYTQLARALGMHAERVEDPEDLRSAFHRALQNTKQGLPSLVEVITCDDATLAGGN